MAQGASGGHHHQRIAERHVQLLPVRPVQGAGRCRGQSEQGNYPGGGNGEMEPLRAYLLAKLLWNPNTDLEKQITEFLNAYYGKAANNVRAYLELLRRQVREKGYHTHIYDPPTAPYL